MSYEKLDESGILLRLTFVPIICIFFHMKNRKVILFNSDTLVPWQAYENTQVMVSNRNGKDTQIFCRADEVQIGDNVWEHNIVRNIRVINNEVSKVKWHYGPTM